MSAIELAENTLNECIAHYDVERGHVKADELICNLLLAVCAVPPTGDDVDRIKRIVETYRKACKEEWYYA